MIGWVVLLAAPADARKPAREPTERPEPAVAPSACSSPAPLPLPPHAIRRFGARLAGEERFAPSPDLSLVASVVPPDVGSPACLRLRDGDGRLLRDVPLPGLAALGWAGGVLWASADQGLVRVGADGRVTEVPVRTSEPGPLRTGGGEAWLQTSEGLMLLGAGGPGKPTPVPEADRVVAVHSGAVLLRRDGQISVWTPATGARVPLDPGYALERVEFSTDGAHVIGIGGGNRPTVTVFDPATGQRRTSMDTHDASTSCASASLLLADQITELAVVPIGGGPVRRVAYTQEYAHGDLSCTDHRALILGEGGWTAFDLDAGAPLPGPVLANPVGSVRQSRIDGDSLIVRAKLELPGVAWSVSEGAATGVVAPAAPAAVKGEPWWTAELGGVRIRFDPDRRYVEVLRGDEVAWSVERPRDLVALEERGPEPRAAVVVDRPGDLAIVVGLYDGVERCRVGGLTDRSPAFALVGGRLVIGHEDGSVAAYDRACRPAWREHAHDGGVTALVTDGTTVVSIGEDGAAVGWRMSDGP